MSITDFKKGEFMKSTKIVVVLMSIMISSSCFAAIIVKNSSDYRMEVDVMRGEDVDNPTAVVPPFFMEPGDERTLTEKELAPLNAGKGELRVEMTALDENGKEIDSSDNSILFMPVYLMPAPTKLMPKAKGMDISFEGTVDTDTEDGVPNVIIEIEN